MTLTDILDRSRVLPSLEGRTKEEVLAELARLMAPSVPVGGPEQIVEVLRGRERLTSTAIGEGVAIPHGRVSSLRDVVAGFARSEAGVDFDSIDGKPTRIFFVLLAPDDAAALHLKALARISRLLKDASFRERLAALDGRDLLYEAIATEDARF